MPTVLIVDDEPGIREVLGEILRDEGYQTLEAADGLQAVNQVRSEPVDLVLLDVWLPGMGGIEVLQTVKEEFPTLEVIVISGHGTIDTAVRAVKAGAFDFLEKPLSLDRVLTLTRNALQVARLRLENSRLRQSLGGEHEMLGASAPMQKIRTIVKQAAASDARVLITGENGTGKELVARAIHRLGSRSERPFLEVNCAAIPDTLIESELFGHEQGSFTGASSRRRGKFELAHGGTLFLDEVADLSLSAQAKMLRALQELSFHRIGGDELVRVDVRIIAATNKDISAAIESGAFRQDLFFRLNVIPISVPPLRDRTEDIPVLAEHFLQLIATREQAEVRTLSDAAIERLAAYPWPGNIRELRNVVERLAVMSDETLIQDDLVSYYLDETSVSDGEGLDAVFHGMSMSEARELLERRMIEHALRETGGNLTRAAGLLGMSPSNLHAKTRRYGIDTDG